MPYAGWTRQWDFVPSSGPVATAVHPTNMFAYVTQRLAPVLSVLAMSPDSKTEIQVSLLCTYMHSHNRL